MPLMQKNIKNTSHGPHANNFTTRQAAQSRAWNQKWSSPFHTASPAHGPGTQFIPTQHFLHQIPPALQ